MKYFVKILLPAMVLLLGIAGCEEEGKDDTSSVTLQFNAKYGNDDFALNSPNTDDNGRKLKFEKFKFFVSHIRLVKNDNSEVELKDVAIVDLSNTGSLQIKSNVDAGDFKAIKFGIGVDSIQNLVNPLTAPAGSPQSSGVVGEMYWSWLKYVHIFVEGRYAASGSNTYSSPLMYHIGSNSLYRQVSFTKSISAVNNADTKLTLTLDVEKVFNTTPAIDIATEALTETQEDERYLIAEKFANNFAQAFTLE